MSSAGPLGISAAGGITLEKAIGLVEEAAQGEPDCLDVKLGRTCLENGLLVTTIPHDESLQDSRAKLLSTVYGKIGQSVPSAPHSSDIRLARIEGRSLPPSDRNAWCEHVARTLPPAETILLGGVTLVDLGNQGSPDQEIQALHL